VASVSDSDSTSERMYGSNKARKSCLTLASRAGTYVSGSSAGKTTTNTRPRPFSIVHRTLYPSFSNPSPLGVVLPSIKVSRMRALTGEAGVSASVANAGVKDLDHSTRPPGVSPCLWQVECSL